MNCWSNKWIIYSLWDPNKRRNVIISILRILRSFLINIRATTSLLQSHCCIVTISWRVAFIAQGIWIITSLVWYDTRWIFQGRHGSEPKAISSFYIEVTIQSNEKCICFSNTPNDCFLFPFNSIETSEDRYSTDTEIQTISQNTAVCSFFLC